MSNEARCKDEKALSKGMGGIYNTEHTPNHLPYLATQKGLKGKQIVKCPKRHVARMEMH